MPRKPEQPKPGVMSVSRFRNLTYADLRALTGPVMIEEFSDKPIVALVPYKEYLEMQNIIIKLNDKLSDTWG